MGETTAIKWTDHTFNPWQGCVKVSPACDHCYAESLSKRVGHPERWGADGERAVTSDGYWRNPLRWNAAAASDGLPHRVFCGSMCDVFEDRDDLAEPRSRLWDLIETTPHLTWQLLTKRPENISYGVPGRWHTSWPQHVWIGCTVEDQERAEERLPILISSTPREAVRFLSCEPLLGRLDIRWALGAIGWVICGGESGAGHRPLNLSYATDLRDQCKQAEVPFFFKQVGGRTPTAGGDLLDGVAHHEFPALRREVVR